MSGIQPRSRMPRQFAPVPVPRRRRTKPREPDKRSPRLWSPDRSGTWRRGLARSRTSAASVPNAPAPPRNRLPERRYFVSEASVYRLLKAHDLITSPAYIVIKAAAEFKDKTTAPNQLWQTDFTYLKIAGWGWYYLSSVLDDFSRFIVAWKLCTTMTAQDVTATLDLALEASGLDRMTVRALASDAQEPHSAGALLPARRSRTAGRRVRRAVQSRPISREPRQSHARRRLFWRGRTHPPRTRKDQTPDPHKPPFAASSPGRHNITTR